MQNATYIEPINGFVLLKFPRSFQRTTNKNSDGLMVTLCIAQGFSAGCIDTPTDTGCWLYFTEKTPSDFVWGDENFAVWREELSTVRKYGLEYYITDESEPTV
jgi:hypothetical protein